MFYTPTHTPTSSSTISRQFRENPEFYQNSTKTDVLVIIDAQVQDCKQLLKGVVPGVNVKLLNTTQDGVRQITQTLRENPNLSEIHILSHGCQGSLQLGNTQLSLDTLKLYANELKTWSVSQIMLYGCNVAAGEAGVEFIEKLHQLTGAKIAASVNKTGHSAVGGDWNLEVKTDEFEGSFPLTSEAIESYRFAFPLAIEELRVERIPPDEDSGNISYIAPDIQRNVPEETEIQYNFQQGDNNLLVIRSFTSPLQEEFLAGDILNHFELRRVDNENIQGARQLLWFERESETDTELNLRPPFAQIPADNTDDDLMEVTLFDDVINRGTDNIFANQTNTPDENINNIERIDYISTDGLQAPLENLDEVGFLILERGGNDGFKIAPILALDAQTGLPTEFGNLVEITGDLWGVDQSITLDTSVLRADQPGENLLRRNNVEGQNVGGIYISFNDLGIEARQQFNGYALFATDVQQTDDLVDFESFPTDTSEDVGGLDLIAGGVVYGQIFININDVTVIEGEPAQFTVNIPSPVNTPITIDYATSDTDLETGEATATAFEDFTPITEGTITIPAGETEVTVNIETLVDNIEENDEQFRVLLSNPSRGFIIDREGIATIVDAAVPTTTVSGTVFTDTNGDDSLSENEPGLQGIDVGLLINTEVDISEVFATVETNADGSYQFDDVIPGEYSIEVNTTDENIPEGAILGTENNLPVTVAANQPVTGINFGFDPTVENTAPVAEPDTAETAANTEVNLNILENDSDTDGNIDPTTVDLNPETPELESTREVPGVGSYTVDETGVVTFTPEAEFTGTSTINYTVQDDVGTPTEPTAITVTVNPPANVLPTATDENVNTPFETPVTFNLADNIS
ncbi:MAG: DUF4347 domain-containing protein, partial [Limnoraphis robusta]